MGRLDGKVALITGGASRMGKTAVLLFAREGAKVVVADISVAAGEETTKTVKDAGADAIFVRADVSNAEDVKNMVRKAVVSLCRCGVKHYDQIDYRRNGICRCGAGTYIG